MIHLILLDSMLHDLEKKMNKVGPTDLTEVGIVLTFESAKTQKKGTVWNEWHAFCSALNGFW